MVQSVYILRILAGQYMYLALYLKSVNTYVISVYLLADMDYCSYIKVHSINIHIFCCHYKCKNFSTWKPDLHCTHLEIK